MASSDSGENRRPTKPHNHGPPPPEQQHLPCPRCDSTNTKFCYYNNYNLSQPRHFCKSCRRYWTHGGTLRDIPVGGGSRKNAKRSRTVPSTTVTSAFSQDHTVLLPMPVTQGASLQFGATGGGVEGDVKGNVNVCGSFASLLNNGFGLGLGDVGFGMGRMGWAFPGIADGANIGGGVVASGIGNSWQFESSGGEGGFLGGDHCFSWPGLAISTPENSLK